MKAVIQRVSRASVTIAAREHSRIGPGILVLLGVEKGDTVEDATTLAKKIVELRIFEDEAGKMNRALADVAGGLLLVSQFTLYGDTSRGRRPGFDAAMPPAEAEPLYDRVVALARERHAVVETGRFRADMRVLVDNDGPVTLLLETPTA